MDLRKKMVDEMVKWLEEQNYSKRVIDAFEGEILSCYRDWG